MGPRWPDIDPGGPFFRFWADGRARLTKETSVQLITAGQGGGMLGVEIFVEDYLGNSQFKAGDIVRVDVTLISRTRR